MAWAKIGEEAKGDGWNQFEGPRFSRGLSPRGIIVTPYFAGLLRGDGARNEDSRPSPFEACAMLEKDLVDLIRWDFLKRQFNVLLGNVCFYFPFGDS